MLACCYVFSDTVTTVIHPTPQEEQAEKLRLEAEAQARKQAAEDALKQMNEQGKNAQPGVDRPVKSSDSDAALTTTASGAEVAGSTSSSEDEASTDADEKKEDVTEDEDTDLDSLLDDRPNYFEPFPDPDGGV